MIVAHKSQGCNGLGGLAWARGWPRRAGAAKSRFSVLWGIPARRDPSHRFQSQRPIDSTLADKQPVPPNREAVEHHSPGSVPTLSGRHPGLAVPHIRGTLKGFHKRPRFVQPFQGCDPFLLFLVTQGGARRLRRQRLPWAMILGPRWGRRNRSSGPVFGSLGQRCAMPQPPCRSPGNESKNHSAKRIRTGPSRPESNTGHRAALKGR